MKALGIDERDIYVNHASGKVFNRPKYQNTKKHLHSSNYEAINSEWKEITRKINADIVVLENETLFGSRKFKAINTEDSQLSSLM